jgi:hypothetical protein
MSKYDEVLKPFVSLMERELHANSGKGDRPGWLSMSAYDCMLEIYYHAAKLQKSIKDSNGDGIAEYSADVANMAMMVADICGAIHLASPAVERQPLGYVHQWEVECIAAGNAHWATMWNSDGTNNPSRNGSPAIAVYTAPPELAELQATIARLTAEIERLKGGQRESVAWSYCPECGCEDLHHEHGVHKQCANCYQEWFSDIDYLEVVRGNLEKLKASQPAPVSLVLPERMTWAGAHDLLQAIHADTYVDPQIAADLYDYAIDKVKELNQ